MIEVKLSKWVRPIEKDLWIQHMIRDEGANPNQLKDPYDERIAVLLQLHGKDKFKVAFALKTGEDQHNNKLENAILRYRIEHKPLTPEDFNMKELKDELFSDVISYMRDKLQVDDASKSSLTRTFCKLAVQYIDYPEYYEADDYLHAIFNYNHDKKNKNRAKIPVPPYLKKEYQELKKHHK